MPKTEEVAAPEAATAEELDEITSCFKYTGSNFLTPWESGFIEALYKKQAENFVLMLSKKQRHYLSKIWEKLYDQGYVV